jgi:DNA-3-methyladenine glycosylase I
MSRGAKIGPDGVARCPWGNTPAEYQRYHDREWGRPVGDDIRIFEKLCLEGFQGGLSWLTILRKRESFRSAFARFDPETVAGYEEDDIERLLRDASIVRNRAKITATIENARAMLRLAEQGLSLAALVWQHEPAACPPPKEMAGLPAATPESKALSAVLRKHGFRFVGPTTVYAAMQSLGVVNDHLVGCESREACNTERSTFTRPG